MKVCILTSSYPTHSKSSGVTAGFARDLALELVNNGCEVIVITPQKAKTIGDEYKINDPKIKVIVFKWLFAQDDLSILRFSSLKDIARIVSINLVGQYQLFKVLMKEKIDFMLAMWAVPYGLWALIANVFTKVPYVVWCLGSDIWIYGRNNKTKWLIRTILRRARLAYADGEGLRVEVQNISGRDCRFLPTSRKLDTTDVNTENPFNNGKKNFVFIGRYHNSKGADVLVDAINLIPRAQQVDLNFELYGNGEDEQILKNKVKDYGLNNVCINGFAETKKVAGLMKHAHFIIIPSRFDSIPMTFSEALQCKTPMITSNVGDLGLLVEKYRIGFVFEKENAQQLADLILKASQQDKNKFNEGLDTALEIFDVKKAANKLIADFK